MLENFVMFILIRTIKIINQYMYKYMIYMYGTVHMSPIPVYQGHSQDVKVNSGIYFLIRRYIQDSRLKVK